MFGIGTLAQMGLIVGSADLYSQLRMVALEAAARNNAAIWFVERDLTNIFTNSDGGGGTPATGGLVGLVLPPGRTPGAELFAGGDGSALGTWQNSNGTVTLNNGEFRLDTSAAFGGSSRVISTVAGRWYECTATYRSGLGNGCNVFLRPGGADTTTDQIQFPSNTSSTPVTATRYIRATGTQMWLRLTSLLNAGGDVCYFDNLSFREVGGFVLESPTTSQKPITAQPPGANDLGLRFDGSDDRLRSITSPLSATAGNPYTLIFAGRLGTASIPAGPRIAVSDGRGLGVNGNGTAASAESSHGGTNRTPFPGTWELNARRVATATYRRAPDTLTQRFDGAQVSSTAVAPSTIVTPDFYVGARSGTNEFWQGDIFLACAAPSVIPTADIRDIERFGAFLAGAPYV